MEKIKDFFVRTVILGIYLFPLICIIIAAVALNPLFDRIGGKEKHCFSVQEQNIICSELNFNNNVRLKKTRMMNKNEAFITAEFKGILQDAIKNLFKNFSEYDTQKIAKSIYQYKSEDYYGKTYYNMTECITDYFIENRLTDKQKELFDKNNYNMLIYPQNNGKLIIKLEFVTTSDELYEVFKNGINYYKLIFNVIIIAVIIICVYAQYHFFKRHIGYL